MDGSRVNDQNDPANSKGNARSDAPLVSMSDIDLAFGGVYAVKKASLDLYAGEVVALLGHNGAGKSTLVNVLAGVLRPDGGSIHLAGEEVSISSPRAARMLGIETIYQNLALAGNLDAASNIFLGRELRIAGLFRNKRLMRDKAREVLQRINPRLVNVDELVQNFSGGQRQSVAIARAVCFDARVIILDEPTAALGPTEARHVKDIILRLRDEGVAILLISHDIHDVFELADRLVVMSDGRVVGRQNTADVTKQEVLSMIILGSAEDGQTAEARSLIDSIL
jgi:D-xylose transport system ATP-binding protein